MSRLLTTALLLGQTFAYDTVLGFNSRPTVETRTIDEIYSAALKEGGTVTVWHGGDEKDQQDSLKSAFEKRFPGMTLNITVDLSKYLDSELDQQLYHNNVFVDSIVLQTLQDFPRWQQEGALLNYAPVGFDKVYPAFKDSISASWYGYSVFFWSLSWNTAKLPHVSNISSYSDFLKPEFKNQIVITYPNDDDAVLFAFYQIMQQLGTKWFDDLLKQNPRWVRGTATPFTILSGANYSQSATFTSFSGFNPGNNIKISFPTDANFVSWPQTAAILKDAPHPESAKLFHNFLLSSEFQKTLPLSARQDINSSSSPYHDIMHTPHTNPTAFARFMSDRVTVERVRFFFENRLGTAQGLSPLIDDI
ncbi:uncharacterized protein TrAtP1_009420 [Trichoderma atroviride]|uniref:ABC-type Fe3+ transport system n=1 Tax=Hypocrea atroviridis (strain ATCC 20476 / IMI 206040) TaxID=452589 RepID=G9NLL8_HYPAI|nr:uncharacterized protein TRIATDRAFT_83650 [Trichoderma atroviride IMI 206040]EHK48780.1 hypothetical protein TRIATDRAFT_83650 [Trichoderma atroviride IMI 206040]UKZ68381.1 hypothetical protein TrAtP1_009420 [Trichoderma atroviride]